MIPFKKTFLPLSIAAAVTLSLSACFHDEAEEETDLHANAISLTLSSAQVITSASASSTDTGIATLEYHEDDGELTGSIMFMGEVPAALHVHNGFAGQTGTPVITLEQSSTDSMIWLIPDDQANLIDVDTLEAGGYYINAHLSNAQTLRAQIYKHGTTVIVTSLEPQTQNGITTGGGFVGVTLNSETREIMTYVTITDLADNGGVHLHIDNADGSTSQLIPLNDSDTPATNMHYAATAGSVITEEALENIEAARWYVNIHNATDSLVVELKGTLESISHH